MTTSQQIYNKWQKTFLDLAQNIAVEMFKGYVPVDTRALQNSIAAYKKDNSTIVGVTNQILDYSEKVDNNPYANEEDRYINSIVLSHILEIGRALDSTTIHRSQDADYPGPGRDYGDPTRAWWSTANIELDKELEPILEKCYNSMLEELTNNAFIEAGWKRK
jgi:hypothetical protein